jgi:glycerol-3-phosphate dehydrogenase
MATLSTDLLVIGGGATGTGVAWDAAIEAKSGGPKSRAGLIA